MSAINYQLSTAIRFSGDFVDRVTPVPIPNTEVKPVGADDTARLPVWESRKSPDLIQNSEARFFIEAGFFAVSIISVGLTLTTDLFSRPLQNQISAGCLNTKPIDILNVSNAFCYP